MTFTIKWDPKAAKQLEKLPKEVIARILAKVRLAGETGRFIEPLTEHEYGCKIKIEIIECWLMSRITRKNCTSDTLVTVKTYIREHNDVVSSYTCSECIYSS